MVAEIIRDINGYRVVYTPGKEDQARVYEATHDDFGMPYYARRWDTLRPESQLFRDVFLKILKTEEGQ